MTCLQPLVVEPKAIANVQASAVESEVAILRDLQDVTVGRKSLRLPLKQRPSHNSSLL